MKMISSPDPKILTAIKEFLEYHGLSKSVESLTMDVMKAGFAFGTIDVAPSEEDSSESNDSMIIQNELMVLFGQGEKDEFLSKFKNSIPRDVQLCEKTCITLMFELNLYFLVYPLRGNHNLDLFKQRHNEFVTYLERVASQDGTIVNSSLAKFLCLGLSSIASKPLDNFMINELLQPTWSHSLKERLSKFLTTFLPKNKPPYLNSLLKTGIPDTRNSNDNQRIKLLEAKCIQYKGLYVQQQQEYFNVLSVATELVESLENAILGKPVDPSTIERVCNQLFKNDVPATIDFSRPGTASNALRKSVVKQEKSLHSIKLEENVAGLDILKIKVDFISDLDAISKSYIIQALRWRLSKSSTEIERNLLIQSFITNDIVGLNDKSYSESVIKCLLHSQNTLLKENFLRLLYCMSAIGDGCKYLSDHSFLISQLIDTLIKTTKDDLIRQVTLLALQGLSLRRNVQGQMLNSDIMPWLLKLLQEPDDLSEYTLHHATALLMNLSLRTKGRIYISNNSGKLLSVVEGLLEHESPLVREYINGILFSALTMENVRDAALDLGMDESLKLLITMSPPETSHQLEFCLNQLQNPPSTAAPVEGDSEDEAEEEVIEDNQESLLLDLQLPENLPLDPQRQGEELLCSQYLVQIKLTADDTETIIPQGSPGSVPQQTSAGSSVGPSDGTQGPGTSTPRTLTPKPSTPTTNARRSPVPRSPSPRMPPLPASPTPSADEPMMRKATSRPATRDNPLKTNSDSAQFINNPDDRPIKPATIDFNRITESGVTNR